MADCTNFVTKSNSVTLIRQFQLAVMTNVTLVNALSFISLEQPFGRAHTANATLQSALAIEAGVVYPYSSVRHTDVEP